MHRTTLRRGAPAVAAAVLVLLLLVVPGATPAPATGGAEPPTVVEGDGTLTLQNGVISRTFSLRPFGTVGMRDLRTGFTTGAAEDLRLEAPGRTVSGSDLAVAASRVLDVADGGTALELILTGPLLPAGEVIRTYTMYPGIAGVQVDTTVAAPGAWTGYTLDAVGLSGGTATAHAFNAGYDWRGSDTPDWEPAVAPAGGAHTGDHRVSTTAPSLDQSAQWLSVGSSDGAGRVFSVVQRVNYDSTHVAYDGTEARVHVDLRDDLAYLGPFEADVHLDNPTEAPLRARTVVPGQALRLETVFTGLALDEDDEAWQHLRYLRDVAWGDWRPTVTFNSNGVDTNRISTGAKDDMDFGEVERQAEVARRLGVETFILDDGWQAASGDWCPDSAACPEPRALYPDRFPDDTFAAVRDAIAPMDLGLWMSPMHFNPAAEAYRSNPAWACTPLGDGLSVYNTLEPDSSSNEAGLGTWNAGSADLIGHMEGRITRAIEVYGSTYFKFDFLAWLDCAKGADTVDAYGYREAFVAMVDRLIAAHPSVTFQIDETNDYRLFPFESASRGPSWFANGNPTPDQSLHNLWVLSPHVPATTVGQSALGRHKTHDADYLMAIALTSHITMFNDLTTYSDETVAAARRWVDLYERERDRFTGLVLPLLDDPIGGETWTGLQPWDPDAQRGALLVFRQNAPEASTVVALRGIRGDGSYALRDPFTGAVERIATADELRAGIVVEIAETEQAEVWLVDALD